MHGSFAFRIKRVDGMGSFKNYCKQKEGAVAFFLL